MRIDWTVFSIDRDTMLGAVSTDELLVALLVLLLVLVIARSVRAPRTARSRRLSGASRTLAARGAAPHAIARQMRIAHDVATLIVRRETGAVPRGSLYRRPISAMMWTDGPVAAAPGGMTPPLAGRSPRAGALRS
jgi:hypothetical protein